MVTVSGRASGTALPRALVGACVVTLSGRISGHSSGSISGHFSGRMSGHSSGSISGHFNGRISGHSIVGALVVTLMGALVVTLMGALVVTLLEAWVVSPFEDKAEGQTASRTAWHEVPPTPSEGPPGTPVDLPDAHGGSARASKQITLGPGNRRTRP